MAMMLKNDSWSHTPEAAFSDSRDCDFGKGAMSLESNDTEINDHFLENSNMCTVISAGSPIVAAGSGATHSNSYGYSHIEASQIGNGHDLSENNHEDKESDDLLFNGWSDIVNLEDADNLFRSFHSTFGCGEFCNEDEFSWLSSQSIEGSDAVLKSDSRLPFSGSSALEHAVEQDGTSKEHNTRSSTDEPCCSPYGSSKSALWASESGDPNAHFTSMDESGAFSEITFELPPKLQVHQSGVENHGDVKGGRNRKSVKLDSSNVLETSCLSSEVDKIDLEASRLCQLQQVMHQLDKRTKLCLRDGLYRLARNAEQRHSCTSVNGGSVEDRDTNGLLIIEGTRGCNDQMDIETNTNTIDRSIAHLLFHRSLDQSGNSACDGSSPKSHAMVNGFITDTPPFFAENLGCGEETSC